MSVVNTDIVIYGSANMQENDSASPQGGAIDLTTRVIFTDISALDNIEILSSNVADAMNITITGRRAGGAVISETIAVNGTSVVTTTNSFLRILKIVLASPAAGTITIRKASDNVTIATMEPGLTTIKRVFYNVASAATGGATRTFYEKVFIKNNNSNTDLLNILLSETSDGTEAGGANVEFAVEDAQEDNNTSTNRITAPAGGMQDSFSDSDKTIPGSDLLFGDSIGVWLRLTLPAGTSPLATTFVLNVAGDTI